MTALPDDVEAKLLDLAVQLATVMTRDPKWGGAITMHETLRQVYRLGTEAPRKGRQLTDAELAAIRAAIRFHTGLSYRDIKQIEAACAKAWGIELEDEP